MFFCFTLYITSRQYITLHNIACLYGVGFFAKNFFENEKYDQTIRHLSVRAVNDTKKKKKKGWQGREFFTKLGLNWGFYKEKFRKKKKKTKKKTKKTKKIDVKWSRNPGV